MNVFAVYFSPTGTTKKIVLKIASKLGYDFQVKDSTLPQNRTETLSFCEKDVVVFGVPVYAGRVPNVLLPFLRERVNGNGALAVPVVLYGNRNYDDALIELRDILEETGFHTIAAGAFIGEHAFSKKLAAGRPDDADLRLAEKFAEMVLEKMQSNKPISPVYVRGESPIRPYFVPRDRQGNAVNILKVKPVTLESCTGCGICAAVCPVGSIRTDNYSEFSGICIKCGACIKNCPVGAKCYTDENFLYHQHELEESYARRAEPELFI